MDPITHSLVGGLAAKTVGASKRRFWIMMALGEIADLDVVSAFFFPQIDLLAHRGITHSLIGLIVQAFFYAFALGKWDKGSLSERAFHYSLPIALHIFCDSLTGFGVPLFLPFSTGEYSANLVVSLTLIPMLITAVGLARLHRSGSGGWAAARPLWACWALYLTFTYAGKSYATRLTDQPSRVWTTKPKTFNPFSWNAVYVDQETNAYRCYSVDLLNGRATQDFVVPMPTGDYPVQASLESPAVQEFLQHGGFPVARTTRTNDGWFVEWGTILYSSRGLIKSKLLVDVSIDGKVRAVKKAQKFWDPVKA